MFPPPPPTAAPSVGEAIESRSKASVEAEAKAEQLMTLRTYLVDLDRRRNQNREAIRVIEKKHLRKQSKRRSTGNNASETASSGTSSSSDDDDDEGSTAPVWIMTNDVFLLKTASDAKMRIEREQKELSAEIEEARAEVKKCVKELANVEGPGSGLAEQLKGFDLLPVSSGTPGK